MSLLTIYRPNFCSACGAKIVRLRWFVWTSRRFCDACSPKFRKEDWVQPIVILVALLFGGFVVGRSLRPKTPPLIIHRNVVNEAGTVQPAATVVADEIYLCGARTKKGTPCSRRVHGPVRCWQHKGVKAMLPDEKLKIVE